MSGIAGEQCPRRGAEPLEAFADGRQVAAVYHLHGVAQIRIRASEKFCEFLPLFSEGLGVKLLGEIKQLRIERLVAIFIIIHLLRDCFGFILVEIPAFRGVFRLFGE